MLLTPMVLTITGLVTFLLGGLAVAVATVVIIATLPVIIKLISATASCPETIVGLANLGSVLAVIRSIRSYTISTPITLASAPTSTLCLATTRGSLSKLHVHSILRIEECVGLKSF